MSDISNMTPEDQNLLKYLELSEKRSGGSISEDELKALTEIAQSEPRANELEDVYNKVQSKEAGIDEYNTIYEMYKQELIATYGDITTKKVDKDTQMKIIEYLNLEAKRSEEELTEEEKNKITEYSSIEEVKVLEEAHTKLANKEINVSVLKEIREKYKNIVLENLKSLGEDTSSIKIEDKKLYEEKEEVKFSRDTQDIIDYFKIEIKRATEELSDEEKDKLKKMGFSSSKVMALEETHKRIANKKLPLNVLKILRNKYKKEASEEIVSKGLNPDDYFGDDSVLYEGLKEYENTPIAPEELAKKEEPKVEEAKPEPTPVEEPTPEPTPEPQAETPAPTEAPVEEKKETIEELLNKEETPAPEPEPAPVEEPTPQEALIEDSNSQEVTEVVSAMDSDKMKALEEENQKLKDLVAKLQQQLEGQDELANLPEEFKELRKYFALDDKRRANNISAEDIKALRLLTKDSTNPMIEEIENIVRKFITKEYDEAEFVEKHKKAHTKYRELLEKEIEKCKENK